MLTRFSTQGWVVSSMVIPGEKLAALDMAERMMRMSSSLCSVELSVCCGSEVRMCQVLVWCS